MPEITKFNAKGFDIGNRKTGQIKIVCPLCIDQRVNKRDKALSINIDSGMFKCHCCETSGNIHEFKTSEFKKREFSKPPVQSELDINQNTVEWFKSRSISLETLKKAKITTGKEWMPGIEKECQVIKFNYFRNNELVNIKYRNRQKDFKLFKDAELIFYNLDSIIKTDSIIITEGEIDCLSYIESGIDYVVSVPNGASVGKMEYVDNCIEFLENKTKFYLAVDSDTSGIKLRNELLTRFGIEKCYKIDYKDCKDANEYLIKYGPELLKQTIEKAEPFPVEGIVTIKDYYSEFIELKTNGLHRGLRLGIGLDFIMRWETGRLCIITGIPSHGKGLFVDYITSLFATKYDFKTCFFSPENFPIVLHYESLSEILTGKRLTDFTDQELENVVHFIDNHFSHIKPDDSDYSLNTILEKARQEVFLKGAKIIVVDPWNRVEHQYERGESETKYINKCLTKMAMFAQNNDVLFILVAHPYKMKKIKDTMLYEEPTLYDISGSANFYNQADLGITIYRDFLNNNTKIVVTKVKFRNLGDPGSIEVKYNINNGRYTDFDIENTTWDNSNWLIPKKEYQQVPEQLKFIDETEQPPY